MNCPRCGEDNPAGGKFCRACGIPLGVRCPSCGHAGPADSRFCTECGAALARAGARTGPPAAYTPRHLAERILARHASLEGEIKQVTVVFCDLCDSTALAERLGPERMHELLDRFFEEALAVVHHYEGTVNQFLGDGFMALFGAPLAVEDHARRALFAAAEIRRALAAWPPGAWPGPVQVRIGINTGAVVVGKIGDDLRTDYTAVGDVTNVAARLQQHAGPGEILASGAVRALAGEAVRFESLGPVPVKGKPAPVEVHRLAGLGLRRSPVRDLEDRPLGPFVGREQERATLETLLARAEQGAGVVVGIVGEPGIGKSRLALEFRRGLAAGRVTHLEGRCVPFSQAVPYSLVLDVLRANCGIVDADTPEEIASKVRFGLAEVGLLDDDRVTALLALLGVKEEATAPAPDVVRRRAFDTLRLMTVRGSRRRPLLFVLEDLHWIDRASEEFFAEMADAISGAPVLVLATYRPGYAPPWMGRSYATQLALGGLGPGQGVDIVRAVRPHGADAVARTLVARAGGNPFFLEELARAVDDAGAAAVPATVQGVIAARIDRLAEHPRRLLQLAAVIGRVFPRRVLEAVWDGPRPIDPWLRDLARAEFVHEEAGQEDELAFRHGLTHDVAYASLLERHRRAWHGAVAAAFQALQPPPADLPERLAHHFGLGDDVEAAIDHAIRAGERAQRRWAHADALRYLDDALARLDTLPPSPANGLRRLDAVLRLAEVRFALGRHAEQLAALEAIADLAAAADPPRQAAWHYWVGFLSSLTGARPDAAVAHCERSAAIARAHALPELAARAESCLAQIALFTGDLRRGLALGEHAVESFEQRGDLWWAGRTLGHLSPIANALGEWPRALGYGRRALAHARTLDDQRLTITALLRLASTLIQQGDAAEGLRLCDQALALDPGPFDLAAVRAIRGLGLARAGDTAAGIALLEEVVEWLDRSQLRYTWGLVGLWLAEAHVQAGTGERARPLLERVRADAAARGYRHLEGVARRLLGEALPPGPEADAHLQAAIERLRAVESAPELARALEAAARGRRPGESAT
jgi:class 3 adenylate cyclase/tetratricopeptide (TPR) repeat protein